MSGQNGDWSSLASDWQRQETPELDIAALRREVERRGRGLRRMVWLEIVLTVLVVGVCVFLASDAHRGGSERIVFALMAVFLVIYQAAMTWLRKRDLAATGQDALSLVDLEIRRAGTVLKYWRWGMWSGVLLWLVLYGLFLAGMHADWALPRVAGLAGGMLVNVVVFPLTGLYGWWRCRQARARIHRFNDLRGQLTQ